MEKVNVTIQTLNITVKSLVLNNKRFTKAVFNQLLDIDYWLIQYDEGSVLSNITLDNCIGFVKENNWNYFLLVLEDGYLLKYHFLNNGVFKFSNEDIDMKKIHQLHFSLHENEERVEYELSRFKYEFVDFIANPSNQIFIAL